MFLSVNNRASNTYSRVGLETRVQSADPHGLIVMLFDGILECLNLAQGALEREDTASKGKAIGKAVRLIDEGLKAALSPDGGEITVNLSRLYDYCVVRLTQANLHSDIQAINEVRSLIAPVAESWKAIRTNSPEGH